MASDGLFPDLPDDLSWDNEAYNGEHFFALCEGHDQAYAIGGFRFGYVPMAMDVFTRDIDRPRFVSLAFAFLGPD